MIGGGIGVPPPDPMLFWNGANSRRLEASGHSANSWQATSPGAAVGLLALGWAVQQPARTGDYPTRSADGGSA